MPRLGPKLRALRRREGLTQARMAERLGISASYLNLIEHDKRSLTANLLIKLASEFRLDLVEFGSEKDERLEADLSECFADPMFDGHGLTNQTLHEFVATAPSLARAVLTLYRAYRGTAESVETLAARMVDGEMVKGIDRTRLPSEEVTDLIQKHLNHFPELEEAAEALWTFGGLDVQNLFEGLARHLEEVHGVRVRVTQAGQERGAVRRYDPRRRELAISEVLPPRSRHFQVAHQVALLGHAELLDRLVDDETLTTDESKRLARIVLANYFAGAVLMPYRAFLAAAEAVRYDIELLGHRFRTSFEQVCHRLTTLRRPGAEGVAFHLVKTDLAGNISKRFSASGIRFARLAGACPLWNVNRAFLSPGRIRIQLSRMPDGSDYFCIARTLHHRAGGFTSQESVYAIGLGCRVEEANRLVYADHIDLTRMDEAVVPIGTSCRLCPRMDCEQRAFPSLQQPLRLDENVRGSAFYTSVDRNVEP